MSGVTVSRSLLLLQSLVFIDIVGVGIVRKILFLIFPFPVPEFSLVLSLVLSLSCSQVLPILPELANSFNVTPTMFGLMGTFYGLGQLIGFGKDTHSIWEMTDFTGD